MYIVTYYYTQTQYNEFIGKSSKCKDVNKE